MSTVSGIEIVKAFSRDVIAQAMEILEPQSTLPCYGVAVDQGNLVISLPQAFAEAVCSFNRGRRGLSAVIKVRESTYKLCENLLLKAGSSDGLDYQKGYIEESFVHAFDCLRGERLVKSEKDPVWQFLVNKNWKISAESSSSGKEKIAKAYNCLRQMVQ